MWQLIKEKLPEIHLFHTDWENRAFELSRSIRGHFSYKSYNDIASYNLEEFNSWCKQKICLIEYKDVDPLSVTIYPKFEETKHEGFLLFFISDTSEGIVYTHLYLLGGVIVFLETKNPENGWEWCGLSISSEVFDTGYYRNYHLYNKKVLTYYPISSFQDAKNLIERIQVAQDKITECGGKILQIKENFKIHHTGMIDF